MISRRLWSGVSHAFGVLMLCLLVGGVACVGNGTGDSSSSLVAAGHARESGKSIVTYYGQMWFRTWQYPLIMVLVGTWALTMIMFSFGITGIQAAGEYYKRDREQEKKEQPVVIDGFLESYGAPSHHSFWG